MGTRETLEQRMNEPLRPPIEVVRSYLQLRVSDAVSNDEIQRDMQRLRERDPKRLADTADAIDAVLAGPNPPGVLARLVGWDGNRSLTDSSDEGAADWLRDLAARMRSSLNQPQP